ncbi:ATP-binding cassette domain-containing protein [Lipingzhangella sp. LS1_29]|uniref:ATP-binding cassette domain-containing protein n=1 Tax=Lipingzhangella rawalii TaxID=2055835 RepID=A0ABU2H8L7_9ACTN|nr:ATP-binding cassette domain-containing protein [Lipingzhangella rawalii]MDS1271660.1 ATP-binding cassette domain-containing protein [Lipingzhangella rawalii]
MSAAHVTAEGLCKRYGQVTALDGVDLDVPTGTVVGLLGPNGAGKTTMIRLLTTLARPDAGRARVAGHDVTRAPGMVRRRIGLAGQYAAVDELLTARENLEMFGRLYGLGIRSARGRARELIDHFDLTSAADRPARGYSGGMRRRLDLATSLIPEPDVLFLDEPTTGLDPRSRTGIWSSVRELVSRGTTVILTTQYLEEADQLADRIAVLGAGRVIAEGPPSELKGRIGHDWIDVAIHNAAELSATTEIAERVCGTRPRVDSDALRISVTCTDRVSQLTALVRELDTAGIEAADLSVRRPTLDDVFLALTGADTQPPAISSGSSPAAPTSPLEATR